MTKPVYTKPLQITLPNTKQKSDFSTNAEISAKPLIVTATSIKTSNTSSQTLQAINSRSHIVHYKSSIHASIPANSQAQTSTLFQFPGFQSSFPMAAAPPPTIPDSEDPPHHKHTPWRQALLTVVQNLSPTLPPPQP